MTVPPRRPLRPTSSQPARSAPPAKVLRQPQGRQGRLAGGAEGRSGGPARPQRRGQDHLVLHDRRAWCAPMPARSPSTASPVEHMPIHRRSRLGLSYLPQEASIFRKLNVEENVRAVLELQRDDARQAADARREIERAPDRAAAGPAGRPPARLARAGAVGRRAPPRRDRPRAGHAAALHPAGRAVCRHRPDRRDRDPAHHRFPEVARHRRADHRPQRARNAGHLRPRLHHQRRPCAGAGHARPRSSTTPTCAGCISANTSECDGPRVTRVAPPRAEPRPRRRP